MSCGEHGETSCRAEIACMRSTAQVLDSKSECWMCCVGVWKLAQVTPFYASGGFMTDAD